MAGLAIKDLSRIRFNALAGYARGPNLVLIIEEREWYASENERVLGILTLDRIDDDYGWVIFGRDERLRFRAIDCNVSWPGPDEARAELFERMEHHHTQPDESYHQGDADAPPLSCGRFHVESGPCPVLVDGS